MGHLEWPVTCGKAGSWASNNMVTVQHTYPWTPCILTSELINPGLLVEVVLAPDCGELQQLGLKKFPNSHQPSINVIFIFSKSLETTMNIYKELHIGKFSWANVFSSLSDLHKKARCKTSLNTGDNQWKKPLGSLKSKKNETMKMGVQEKCKETRKNLVKLPEENKRTNDKISKNEYTKGKLGKQSDLNMAEFVQCIKCSEAKCLCSLKTEEILESSESGKIVNSSVNKATELDKGDKKALGETVTECGKSLKGRKGNQPSKLHKISILDTEKLHEVFCSKDICKPDIIKPSMLKKKELENSLKRTSSQCSSKESNKLKDVIPGLVMSSETRKPNRKDVKNSKVLSTFPKHHLPSSDLLKDKSKDTKKSFKWTIKNFTKKNPLMRGCKIKKRKPLNREKLVEGGTCKENKETGCLKDEKICKNSELIEEDKSLIESEEISKSLVLLPVREGELEETNINEKTSKLSKSFSLSHTGKEFSTSYNASKDNVCSKTGLSNYQHLLETSEFKRKIDDKAAEEFCAPRKKVKLSDRDIKQSDTVTISKICDSQENTFNSVNPIDASLGLKKTENTNDGFHSPRMEVRVNNNTDIKEMKDTQNFIFSGNERDRVEEVRKPHQNINPPQPSCPLQIKKLELKSAHIGDKRHQRICKEKEIKSPLPEFECITADSVLDGLEKGSSCVTQDNKEKLKLEANGKVALYSLKDSLAVSDDCIPGTVQILIDKDLKAIVDHPVDLCCLNLKPSNLEYPNNESSQQQKAKPEIMGTEVDMLSLNLSSSNVEKQSLLDVCNETMIVDESTINASKTAKLSSNDIVTSSDMSKKVSMCNSEQSLAVKLPLSSMSVAVVTNELLADGSKLSLVEKSTLPPDKSIPGPLTVCHPPGHSQKPGTCMFSPSNLQCLSEGSLDKEKPSCADKLYDSKFRCHNKFKNEDKFKISNLNCVLVNSDNSSVPSISKVQKTRVSDDASCIKSINVHNSPKFNDKENVSPSQITKFSKVECVQLNPLENQKENAKQIIPDLNNSSASQGFRRIQKKARVDITPRANVTEVFKNTDASSCIALQCSAHNEFGESKSGHSHCLEFDVNPCHRQSSSNLESFCKGMKNKIQSYSNCLASNDVESPLHGGIKTLANFIRKPLHMDQNVRWKYCVENNASNGGQQLGFAHLDKQLRALIVQQLIELHEPRKTKNSKSLSHSLSAEKSCLKSQILQNLQMSGHSSSKHDYYEENHGSENTLKYNELKTNTKPSIVKSSMSSNVGVVRGCQLPVQFCPQRTSSPKTEGESLYTWKGSSSLESSEVLQEPKYIHLLGADQQEVVKLKCLLVNHEKSYSGLKGVELSGGHIYVRPSGLHHLLTHPSLAKLSTLPNVHFGVYNSLLNILNDDAALILKSKWLLLIHHTAMLEESLDKILEEVLKDKDMNASNYHQLFVPSLTLQTCAHVLSGIKKISKKEQELSNILQRNMLKLWKCVAVGAAQVIGGDGGFATLSPESTTSDFVQCLKVLHRDLKFVHRHTTVLVGSSMLKCEATTETFYTLTTVHEATKSIVVNE
ncbi:uro-adherence factor A isoform X3 [Cherax quadricarinatus]|uniref:uro-adherence factor A isoform X3 n=1 Tax=Cherax quadricarinatus TaxID=27406 RepID=UPI00387E81CB